MTAIHPMSRPLPVPAPAPVPGPAPAPDRAPAPAAGPAVRIGRELLRLPGRALLGLLWIYQRFVSPMTPPTCRFYPSCSQYAVIAIRRHGALRGGWLAARRLGRCHPWNPGGVDDVPERTTPSAHHDH